MMIRTIEIYTPIVATTIAKYLTKHYTIRDSHRGTLVTQQEIKDFIHNLLEANQEKQYFSGQAPGNE